jgi:RNA polymerase sigma-70 factor, ECF subfamily
MPFTEITCHMDALYSYAILLARDPAAASDLVQDTYVKAIPAVQRLHEGSYVKGWLFTILRNIWLNKVREAESRPTLVALDAEGHEHIAIDSAVDPLAQYVANWDGRCVRNAIQLLPLKFREVILLREYEEFSYLEISKLLQCPLGTVMSRLARARAQLRDLITSSRTMAQATLDDPKNRSRMHASAIDALGKTTGLAAKDSEHDKNQ